MEFCGLPGAGKSHIVDRVAACLAARGVRVNRPDQRVSADVRALARVGRKATLAGAQVLARPSTSARLAGAIRASRQPRPKDTVALTAQWLLVQRLYTRVMARGGVGLVDEGVVQTLWTIGVRGEWSGILGALRARSRDWVRPALVVVVDVPVPVAIRRLRARASRHSRTQMLELSRMERELDGGRVLLEDLLTWWASFGTGGLLRVANPADRPPDMEIARIVERIESMST